MFRTLLAAAAFFAFLHAASAQTLKDANAYVIAVRKAISAMVYTIDRKGGAEALIQISASGKVTILNLEASDDALKEEIGSKLGALWVPRPPAWAKPPLKLKVPMAFQTRY